MIPSSRHCIRVSGSTEKLNEINVTDKYVAMHARGSDPVNERLNILRTKARSQLFKIALKQPVAIFGGILHFPILALAQIVGTKMGVDEFGDRSVEATMRIVAGLAGVILYYPMVATGFGLYSNSMLYGLAILPVLAISGYTFVHQQPVLTALNTIRGSLRLLLSKNTVDDLRSTRSEIQSDLRMFADKHSPAELQGWWQNPEKYISQSKERRIKETMDFYEGMQRVTPQSIDEAGLTSLSIPLERNKRMENERAVLTFKQLPGNEKALLWIPGRNDSFFHVHILNRILNSGFDIFVLDLRRCGRSKFDVDGVTPCVEDMLLGHDSYDFSEYLEEMDTAVSFLKRPTPMSNDIKGSNQLLLTNEIGCGKYYENLVLYAHSTGALVAAMYGADNSSNNGSWRGAIDGYIFNSPFWDWNLPWYNQMLVDKLDNGMKTGMIAPSTVMNSTGGENSEYSMNLYKTYGFTDPELKNTKDLYVTAGWMNAVKKVQKELEKGKLVLKKPTLVMATSADDVLDSDSIQMMSQRLIWKDDPNLFSFQKIGTSKEEPSGHDLLAAPSAIRVDEAMRHIEHYLYHNFSSEGGEYYNYHVEAHRFLRAWPFHYRSKQNEIGSVISHLQVAYLRFNLL